jgi:signal transduction histidine kinase
MKTALHLAPTPADPDICPISKMPCTGNCIFSEIMETAGPGIVVFDLESRTVPYLNRSAAELFQRLEQPTDFASLAALLAPGGDIDAAPHTHAPEPVAIRSRMVSYTLRRSQTLAWALINDITDKMRLESIAEAVEMMNNIGFVFSALRHELGNPVNSLKTALSVLRANLDVYPRETVLDYLSRMSHEVGRVEVLLRSMKSFSMYERYDKTIVDVCAFLASFERLVREEASRRGIDLVFTCQPSVRAYCDPRALQQVLLNLFANAADALAGRADAAVRIEASNADGLVYLRVIDNGPGVSEEQRKLLFKPFCTSKEQGTGLGLVISRKLLARMEGTIVLDSSPGEGATFTLTLPASPPAAT